MLRVEGESFSVDGKCKGRSIDDEYHDLSLMWYVATPDDALATFDTDHITGSESSYGTYFLSYNEPNTNKPATYTNGQGSPVSYTSNFFLAFNVDQKDQYDAKKYFYNECKDKVGTTPPTLFDPESLYRAETSYSGNLVMMQKFYELPFLTDIHFGYRNFTFTKQEMDIESMTEALTAGYASFEK